MREKEREGEIACENERARKEEREEDEKKKRAKEKRNVRTREERKKILENLCRIRESEKQRSVRRNDERSYGYVWFSASRFHAFLPIFSLALRPVCRNKLSKYTRNLARTVKT